MEEKLRTFGAMVNDLIGGKDISRAQAKDMFRQVLLNEQPDLQQGAFLAAITAKGATPQEIAGSWEAIYEIDTIKVTPSVTSPLVDNCGTGMDTLKTFNISTAASIVAAADGIIMAKHGARAITSRCGTVDIVEALGVDVECDAAIVKRSIEKAGIGLFNGMSPKVHPTALGRILSQIRFGTILNIAGSLANPALPRYGVRGVYSEAMLTPTLETMKEMGYHQAVVFHGLNAVGNKGMDEMSTLGPTKVMELDRHGTITSYTIDSSAIGLELAREEELLTSGDRELEALKLLRLLRGEEAGPRRDIVCLNAAPILYMMGHADSLKDGVERARSILDDGRAVKKLQDWIRAQSSDPTMGEGRFNELMSRADIPA
ncbi:MAG: anthranilate phosphoribosyltransferase [Methanomassiliicoccus sp.]|nr:anthranilate phosphoribosyltransferase [Methanomassiliicoccus sp.]